jgi:transposase
MIQEELLAIKKEPSNWISIGNGYSIEWVTKNLIIIYRHGIPFKKVQITAQIEKRRIAVELVLECGVGRQKLAGALEISRQSLNNWIDTYKRSGLEGLVNSYKGSKRKGREEKADKLPTGNKARELEEERRERREEIQWNQLEIGIVIKDVEGIKGKGEIETEGEIDEGKRERELFEERYGFEENRYAGGLIYWGIFQHFFGIMEHCSYYIGHYSIVVYIFCMMMVQKITAVEQLKTVFKEEFGKIIGLKRLYSKPVLWEKIREVCSLGKSKLLIKGFFHRQAERGIVVLYWLYIDGHFIPYYGKEKVRSGYYTQRDEMMPGQTEMFVHDCNGRIVYFEIEEGKGDLKEMMIRMSKEWSGYMGGSKPLIIADRESWGVEHFISMKGYRFVTWEKFSKREELGKIGEEEFGEIFEVNGRRYQVYEDKKRYSDEKGSRIELRRVVIWNKETNKRCACVTQIEEKEDTIGIARAMLGRWGCSENSFKHMGDRCNMHYNPLLDTTEDSENQEISNPDYRELKKKVREIKKKLEKVERNIGRLPLTVKQDRTVRQSKRRDNLQQERVQLKEEITITEEKLKNCPEKIDLNSISGEKRIKKLDTEGKNLWDLSQSIFWNSRKQLIEMFSKFLSDPRDRIPALEAIISCRGWVRSTPEVIEVRLEPLDTLRFRAAQIQLCRQLNEMKIRLQNGKRLLYDVGNDPRECPKN